MENFERKNLIELRKMKIKELEIYHMELRKYEFDNNIPLKNIILRNKIHPLMILILKIDRILNNETLEVINDERIKTSKPKIFACTHIGGNDIQRTFEAIRDPAYLFLGDPKEIYRDVTGVLLKLNGSICLETWNKEDRKIAKERSIELLNNGGNLLIYPEGAWNIFPNLPVMKLYKGTVSIARQTNADIIPIGIAQYGKNFIVSIGKNISAYENSNISLEEFNLKLRDALATEKWKIFEKNGIVSRTSISNVPLDVYQQEIVNRCSYDFSVKDVYDTMYKDTISPDEVFEPIRKLSL